MLAPLALTVCIATWIGPLPALEDPPAHTDTDPAAHALLDETVKAYKALPGYADQGKFTIALSIDGKPRAESRPMALVFARPNKVALDAGEVQLVGDGKELATTILPSKMFMRSPETRVAPVMFDEGPLGAILLGGPTGPARLALSQRSFRPRSPRPRRPS